MKKLILAYLLAIVLANVTISMFGPSVSIINAFLFIGFDLTTRDKIDDRVKQNKYAFMTALILVGSALSYLVNRGSGNIAIASFVAFLLSGSADYVVYRATEGQSRFNRINKSNAVGAIVDSFVFPTLAFGAVMPAIIVMQFVAKFAGGMFWGFVLRDRQ